MPESENVSQETATTEGETAAEVTKQESPDSSGATAATDSAAGSTASPTADTAADTAAGSESVQTPEPVQDDSVSSADTSPGDAVAPSLPDFSGMLAEAAASSIDLLKDVELDVKIELGRAEMTVNEILHLTGGSVVELDKLAGDPVDILVNEQLIARGEVLVVNDSFCVRINEIIPGISEKIASTAE